MSRAYPSYHFDGQVALVTGAAMGMGLAAATAFAENGARVVMGDVDDAALEEATRALREQGHDVVGVHCDVSDEGQVAALVDTAVERFGRLDMAFNNAGIMAPATDAAEETLEQYERITAINLRGVWACIKHELRVMGPQGSGAIVNNSSLGGLVGNPGRATYHATKHGVLGLTSSVALEYGVRGVRVNAVCPGTIVTPMVQAMLDGGDLTEADAVAGTPLGRMGTAREVAEAVLWLCSPGAAFVLGVALPVDGGYVAR